MASTEMEVIRKSKVEFSSNWWPGLTKLFMFEYWELKCIDVLTLLGFGGGVFKTRSRETPCTTPLGSKLNDDTT